MAENPFKPTAGKMPPILIGRDGIIADFTEGLENGAGAPGRLMLITGQRGYGKTVLLTELGRVAASYGWDVVAETASEGMVGRMVAALESMSPSPRLTQLDVSPAVSMGGITARLGSARLAMETAPLTLRAAIEGRLERLSEGLGILFTVDEAQAASHDDLVALATAIQHVIRDEDMRDVPDSRKHGVAFVFAGLPAVVDDLVNDDVLTFLRRCVRHDLGDVEVVDVKNAYLQSVGDSGKTMGDADALLAARASGGYPYMVQLVGYYMWQSAQRRGRTAIGEEDVRRGIDDASLVFQEAVCAPTIDGLTDAQRTFLWAMIDDLPGPSELSDIATRCEKSASWASKYRASLIRAHVIRPEGRGRVALAVPYLSEYLMAHGSQEAE